MPLPATLRDYLDDGFSTKISFLVAPGIHLWEKTIKPPGLVGGGPIDTTTMYNERLRTQSPKHLISVQDIEFQAAYHPDALNSLITTVIQANTLITVTWPTGDTYELYGWLEEFVPNENSEGEMPLASCKVCISNVNENGAETPPVFTPA